MPNNENSSSCIDIRENDLLELSAQVLDTLLRDHTTGRNIFWATHDYEALGPEYDYHSEILPELITGERGMVVRPRVLKSKENQTDRAKDMAEVFTPSWVCNAQNNLVDEAWFGRKNVFNTEKSTVDVDPVDADLQSASANKGICNPQHRWTTNPNKIVFPDGKTWKDYVRATRMEITCGEAPYLASRYDTTTGKPIPIEQRIGLLDRKLRVVSENTETSGEWLDWTQIAYQNIYGFEWQGDNLLLAREALLWTFIEYYQRKFGKAPLIRSINYIAYIISWNLWQMDGLKGVVPDSCHTEVEMMDLFSSEGKEKPCQGCTDGGYYHHNGTYCMLRDWGAKDPLTGENNRKIRFIDLIKK